MNNMNIICSPAGIVNPFRPGQGIMDIVNAGFKNISLELDMCCSSYELEHFGTLPEEENDSEGRLFPPISEHPEEINSFFKEMFTECERKHLQIPIARAPYLPRDTKRTDLIEEMYRIHEECIRVCGQIGCRYLVIRPWEHDRTGRGAKKPGGTDSNEWNSRGTDSNEWNSDGTDSNEWNFDGTNSNARNSGDTGSDAWNSGKTSSAAWELNREYYLRLAGAARKANVMILLENQCVDRNGHLVRGICSDSETAAHWVDELNNAVHQSEELNSAVHQSEGLNSALHQSEGLNSTVHQLERLNNAVHQPDGLNSAAGREVFGFCMDTGVCSLCGQDMREFAAALGGRIKAVILRDCDGQQEGAMLPFTCTYHGQPQTDWLSLIRGLREICFDGELILSVSDTMMSFSPLLRPQLMALAKATAEYFKWQIEIENLLKKYSSIVLFGAGNMCRNYLKCYGKKYPPLFTCDNNQKIWGSNFYGLEVKPPEALKDLPEGCGIFICNIYYREIERQLRDMGIQNIEFFNDEYMPSFYFDRLKGV